MSKIGIYQGDASIIYNWDQFVNHPNPFAVRDTAVHEGFHAFVNRYLPTISDWSYARNVNLGAIARYPEEVIAYALGRGSVGRVHAVPFAPFEALEELIRLRS